MFKVFSSLVLLSCFNAVVFATPLCADDDVKVHRKTSNASVVAELFVTSWCPYCEQAKSYLASRNVNFKVYDIEKDATAAKRKEELCPGRGVPFAIINGIEIRGWSKKLYQLALDGE